MPKESQHSHIPADCAGTEPKEQHIKRKTEEGYENDLENPVERVCQGKTEWSHKVKSS